MITTYRVRLDHGPFCAQYFFNDYDEAEKCYQRELLSLKQGATVSLVQVEEHELCAAGVNRPQRMPEEVTTLSLPVDPGKMAEECYSCIHMARAPANAHITCRKPDPHMIGDPHGIRNGWFAYPWIFDPIWKRKACANHEKAVDG